jgi:hypothetical protein
MSRLSDFAENLTAEARRSQDRVVVAAVLATGLVLGAVFILIHWYGAAVAILWALACVAAGAAVGFLFGIPNILQDRGPARTDPAHPDQPQQYRQLVNTSLEQISDWLTKILVGLGLTQLERLPRLVQNTAAYMASAMGDGDHQAFAGAVIVYFAVLGFFIGYLSTRLFLSSAFARADRAADEEARAALEQLRLSAPDVRAQVLTEGVGRHPVLKATAAPADDDPQKGKWGGSPRANGRVLTGRVTAVPTGDEWFKVELTVQSEDPAKPLTGEVVFHLHPTCKPCERSVPVAAGVARLEMLAWGAFTVGAEADGGATKLELDLATDLPDAPQEFRQR